MTYQTNNMKLAQYQCRDHIRKNEPTLYWINNRIKTGKIHATFEEITEALTQDQIDDMLIFLLSTRGSLPFRIGAKENVDATWDVHFPIELKIALDFLNDKVTFMGAELMDFDDAGIFEDIQIEVYIVPPTSKLDYKSLR